MHIGQALLPRPQLDDAARAAYDRDGYVVVRDLVPPQELDEMRALYDGLFESRAGYDKGDYFDMLDPEDRPDAARLPQLAWPSKHAPWLAETQARRNAQAVADQLLPGCELVWEFAIRKPPRTGAPTPWHQDEACFTVGTPYDVAVSCWIALQDVDEAMGCMRYVPGSHLGELTPHESVGGDSRAHALAAVAPDVSRAVSVPLRAGDAVLHHSRTMHGAGANTSDMPRRALTLEFAVRDNAKMIRRDFSWNARKYTTRDAREAAATPLLDRLRRGVKRRLIKLGW
jgi:ectoine hydroxylase-related dioxygenase (phytanoyl-CoA dioxygenase family)